MSEAPAELWIRRGTGGYYRTMLEPPRPSAVRYVRADLYEALQDKARIYEEVMVRLAEQQEALQARLAVVRSWGDAPCLEPLKSAGEADYR